jgi:hypothetical protein
MDLLRKLGSFVGLSSADDADAPRSNKRNKRSLSELGSDGAVENDSSAKRRQIATKSRESLADWFDGSREDVHSVTFKANGTLGVRFQDVDDGVCLNQIAAYPPTSDTEVAERDPSEHKQMRIGDYVLAINKADVRHLGVDDLIDLMKAVKRPLVVTFRHSSQDELRVLATKWPSRFGDDAKSCDEKTDKKLSKKERRQLKKNAKAKAEAKLTTQ